MVVDSVSRCLGTARWLALSPSAEMKLFMTRRGGLRYSFPPPFGWRKAFRTSLQREYFSTRKCKVGPLGNSASRRFVLPVEDREKSSR